VAPLRDERVLDLCAAPGGKSTHLAALMGGTGELVAVERNPGRARALLETARRMRANNVRVEVADAQHPLDESPFDRVLVDPPCSGLGTLQARPDLRWRAAAERIGEMRAQQFQILNAGAESLRPGGLLVYSTCTVSPSENERLIADFLNSRTDFGLDDLTVEQPDLALASVGDANSELAAVEARTLQTLPHRDHTAGFFIARLRRS
jgi:16S rRNA (cytosine967-C5)-methyltransferase